MNAARKQEILERIGAWLDDWPDDEALPEGLDPSLVDRDENPPDLASLAAAVVAASRESQIQTKAFKRLQETMGGLSELPDRFEQWAAVTQSCAHDDLLAELADLHDRLLRCVAEGRAAARGLPRRARWGGGKATLESVVQGTALLVERLADVLARADVRAFESDGRAFDPSTMRAVDRVAAAGASAPGTVAATLRRGYLHGERVLRPAEVRVAR